MTTDQPDNVSEPGVSSKDDAGAFNGLRLVPADESNEVPPALLAEALMGQIDLEKA